MAREFSVPNQLVPVALLPAAADAGGRVSAYHSLKGAQKAWIVAHINQGNAAQVTLSPLQATNVAGAGSKAIFAERIWLNDATASADTLTLQTALAATFQTDATLADKLIIFEIEPEVAMDVANGFTSIALQTSASNAANITEALLLIYPRFQGADLINTLVN